MRQVLMYMLFKDKLIIIRIDLLLWPAILSHDPYVPMWCLGSTRSFASYVAFGSTNLHSVMPFGNPFLAPLKEYMSVPM